VFIWIYEYVVEVFTSFIRKLLLVGVLLLEEVVNSFDDEGFLAIIDAAKQWFNESQIRKVAGNASWWRVNAEFLFSLDLEFI
jgi:hypothetical protein